MSSSVHLSASRAETSDSGRYWSVRSAPTSPSGMVSISVRSMPSPWAQRMRSSNSSSLTPFSATAVKGVNEDEFDDLIRWAHGDGMDLTLIETMPLGEVGADRTDQYLPLSEVSARLAERWTLEDIAYKTGGPAR